MSDTKRVSELDEIPIGNVTDNDLLLFTDAELDISYKITYSNLRSAITSGFYSNTNIESLVVDLNQQTNLNASTLNNQAGSFYLNYNNLTNKPFTNTEVTQVKSILVEYAATPYLTSLENLTTDDLNEGFTNLYFTSERFDQLFDVRFAEAYQEVSTDIVNSSVTDSIQTVAARVGTNTLTNQISVGSQFTPLFQQGQNVRVYGASFESSNLENIPTLVSVVKNGFVGEFAGNTIFQYEISEFEYSSGKFTQKTSTGFQATDIDTENFNNINNITLNFNRTSTTYGILIYRKITSDANFSTPEYNLIAVLGPQQLGSNISGSYIDYFAFDYTSWSNKNPNRNDYDTNSNLFVHFPKTAPSNAGRGWIDTTIAAVDLTTNRITLSNTVYMNSSIVISHNDTQVIQNAINSRVAQNLNSLGLNDKVYIVSGLTIPDGFSLFGRGKKSTLKKLSWSSSITNKVIRTTNNLPVSIAALSDIRIDGNLDNQYLVSQVFDPYANYAVDIRGNDIQIKGVIVDNVVGGGISCSESINITVNTCRSTNGSISDRYDYSPLLIQNGTNVICSDNFFQNFPSAVDGSLTNIGIYSSNIISNCGSGLLIFGSTKTISSPNVILGPAQEFIRGPDILNSEFDSVNIVLEANTNFNSDSYVYQENGQPFNLVVNNGSTRYVVNALRKVNNVEELYDEILVANTSPIDAVTTGVDSANGEFRFAISSSNVDELLTTYSFSSMKQNETNHTGLVYRAIHTEYVNSGSIIGAGTYSSGTGLYTVTANNVINTANNSIVILRGHGGTPNMGIPQNEGTVTDIVSNINGTFTISIDFGTAISSPGENGTIAVKNQFVLAKGFIQ